MILFLLLTGGCGPAPSPAEPNEQAAPPEDTVPDRSEEPAALEWGCQVDERSPRVRFARCGEVELRVVLTTSLRGEAGIAHYRQQVAEDGAVDIQSVTVEGAPGLRYSVGGAPRLIAATDDGLLLVCREEDASAGLCRRRLAHIILEGLPPEITFDGSSYELAGRTIDIPTGCEPGEDNLVVCSGAELHWRSDVPREQWHQSPDLLETALLRVGPTRRVDGAACQVFGVEGLGTGFVIESADVTVVLCRATMEGTAVVAQCNLQGDQDTYPEPCTQVFGSGAVPDFED